MAAVRGLDRCAFGVRSLGDFGELRPERLAQERRHLLVLIRALGPGQLLRGAVSKIDGEPASVEAILAEIGVDMRYWPTDEAIASWAKICPGNNESGGKRRSTSIGRGNQSLRSALVEATLAAIRVKDSYFSALYHRVATRRGAKRAIIAVSHAILIVIYHMLKDGTVYNELGGDYFERVDREAILRRSVRRIEKLGYQVTLHEASAA